MKRSDFIPIDLVSEILLRLPANSIARFRTVSKLWRSMLHGPYFTELFLTRSRARPRLFFAIEYCDEWSFYSSPQPQNLYDKSSLVVAAQFHIKFSQFDKLPGFGCMTYGLMFFRLMRISDKNEDTAPVIYNPSTGRYEILPYLDMHLNPRSFLGFDPIEKQFKVLSMCHTSTYDSQQDHRILTLGTGKMMWRKIHCPLTHRFWREGICINGVLYYLESLVIVCFDVRSETFKLIRLESFLYLDYNMATKLINYKGKLGEIGWKYVGNDIELHMWILEDAEKHRWSRYLYTLPENKAVGLSVSNYSIDGVTSTGEIVLSMKNMYGRFYVFYFNPEKNTLQRFEIQGLEKGRVYTFVNHLEDLNVNDALKSSQGLNLIRERPNPTTTTSYIS